MSMMRGESPGDGCRRQLALVCRRPSAADAPISFDVSVWEWVLPLITGAALVVARPEGHEDPAYLAET